MGFVGSKNFRGDLKIPDSKRVKKGSTECGVIPVFSTAVPDPERKNGKFMESKKPLLCDSGERRLLWPSDASIPNG